MKVFSVFLPFLLAIVGSCLAATESAQVLEIAAAQARAQLVPGQRYAITKDGQQNICRNNVSPAGAIYGLSSDYTNKYRGNQT